MRNPENKLESVLRESTRNLIQHLTAIHGYLQLLQSEEISAGARELLRKVIDHDQRACAILESLIGLEQSQKHISASTPISTPMEALRRSAPVQIARPGRVLLVGSDNAALDFQRSVLFHLGGSIAQESNLENLRDLLLGQDFELILIDETCMPVAEVEDFDGWLRAKRPALRERVVFLVSGEQALDKLGLRTLRKPLQLPALIQCSKEFLPFTIVPQTGPERVQ